MSAAPASPPRRYTLEEFASLPDADGFELVDGYLVEVPMGTKSSWVANVLCTRLTMEIQFHDLGYVLPQDTAVALWPRRPANARKPDGWAISKERVPNGRLPDGIMTVPPELAFEVVSPNENATTLRRKVREYLAGGVELVWVIDPVLREAFVYRRDDLRPTIVYEDGVLDASEFFRDVSIRLGDVLPPADWAGDEGDSPEE